MCGIDVGMVHDDTGAHLQLAEGLCHTREDITSTLG